ncbi:MAG: transcriptional repressor [Anaeroplasmataceae bacterium]
MARYKDEILKLVISSNNHLTAEEIYLKLKEYMPKVVLATVYNNLNSLCLENKINRITIQGCPDRYDNVIKHDHLICRKCQKINDIYIGDFSEYLTNRLKINDLTYDLKIYYLCDECKGGMK